MHYPNHAIEKHRSLCGNALLKKSKIEKLRDLKPLQSLLLLEPSKCCPEVSEMKKVLLNYVKCGETERFQDLNSFVIFMIEMCGIV